MKTGILYIVSTPIGNLEDITFRAVETMKSVNLIAAEDTRHSRKLLDFYGISTPTLSLHDYNEEKRARVLCDRLKEGQSIALISDAGTPLLSDPGYRLVALAREAGIRVVPIPGASAALAALVSAGLPTDRFVFEGFLPSKGAAREKRLLTLVHETRTIIFYESVHRILNLFDLLEKHFGSGRRIVVARELTKKFESIRNGRLDEMNAWFQQNKDQQKGEFVLVVSGAEKASTKTNDDHVSLLRTLLKELSVKQAVGLAREITGEKRKSLYHLALEIVNKGSKPISS